MRARSLALPFFIVLLIVLAGLSRTPQAAAQPPLPPSAQAALAGSDSHNLELVGQLGGETRAVDVQGAYAYVSAGPRLVVLDVSDPIEPVAVGQEASVSAPVQGNIETQTLPQLTEVIVEGDYAYVMESFGRGLRIIDISDPTMPDQVGSHDVVGDTGDIAVMGDFIYIANAFGLFILDVSDPASPIEVWDDSEGSVAVATAQDYLYLAAESGGLRILDVSDTSEPQEVGTHPTSTIASDVEFADGYVYLVEPTSGSVGGNLRIIDVSEPANPTEVGLSALPFMPDAVQVVGEVAYVADGESLYLFDVSDPTAPTLTDSYNAGPAWTVAIENSNAYVAGGSGLHILDVSDPTTINRTGYYRSLVFADSVRAAGNYVYAVSQHLGLHIVDVSNASRPRQVGFYPMADFANYFPNQLLFVQGYIYALNGSQIRILDISNPTKPEQANVYSPGGYMFVEGTYGYLMSGGIHILDLSDPTTPQEVGFYPVGGELKAVAAGLAYIIENGTLRIIDVRDPLEPAQASTYQPPEPATSVDVTGVGNFTYLLSNAGMYILDVSDPTSPEEVGFKALPVGNLFAVREYLYLPVPGTGSYTMSVYEISNPVLPKRIGYGHFPPLRQFSIQGDYIYSGGALGLYVIHLEPPEPTAVTFSPLQASSRGVAAPVAALGVTLFGLLALRGRRVLRERVP